MIVDDSDDSNDSDDSDDSDWRGPTLPTPPNPLHPRPPGNLIARSDAARPALSRPGPLRRAAYGWVGGAWVEGGQGGGGGEAGWRGVGAPGLKAAVSTSSAADGVRRAASSEPGRRRSMEKVLRSGSGGRARAASEEGLPTGDILSRDWEKL